MKNKFSKRIDKLRNDIGDELSRLHWHSNATSQHCGLRCIPIEPENDDEYTEFVWLNGEWQVYDYRGLLYSLYAINLERLCRIVDMLKVK